MNTMVQVKLKNKNIFQTAWIEKKQGVKMGVKVELKEDKKRWEIVEMYGEMDAQYAYERERDYTHQREASDI